MRFAQIMFRHRILASKLNSTAPPIHIEHIFIHFRKLLALTHIK
jgi:hypothetical protein